MGLKVNLDCSGLNSVLNNIGSGLFNVRRETGISIAEEIIDKSIKLVPKDTGTLASSTYIIEHESTIEFGYGGPNDHSRIDRETGRLEYASDYAAEVHENLLVEHKNGQAKFLEIPIQQCAGRAKWAIAESFSELLKNAKLGWRGKGKKKEKGAMKWTR